VQPKNATDLATPADANPAESVTAELIGWYATSGEDTRNSGRERNAIEDLDAESFEPDAAEPGAAAPEPEPEQAPAAAAEKAEAPPPLPAANEAQVVSLDAFRKKS